MYKWIKKYFSNPKSIKEYSQLHWMKKYFHHRSLWRINCDSVSRGVAIGLFAAAIPLMPFQMVIAAFLAIMIRANLPISVAVCWISNPFTLVPITYFTYYIGNWVLGEHEVQLAVHEYGLNYWSYSSFWNYGNETSHYYWSSFSHFGKAFFVGLPIVAIGAAIAGYLIVNIVCRSNTLIRARHAGKHKPHE